MTQSHRSPVVAFLAGLLLASPALAQKPLPPPPPYQAPPASQKFVMGQPEDFCPMGNAEWRKKQTVDGVSVDEDPVCEPDDPNVIAAVVKGTNNVSMDVLMKTKLSMDAVEIDPDSDYDHDGDPDNITIRLEVVELNGRSPDFPGTVPQYYIAPGVTPGFWAFAPKTTDMSSKNFVSGEAHSLLRMPSPTIRVEQGDKVTIILENTHYFPHSIHLHGVDHPFVTEKGEGNDGVPETSEGMTMPGGAKSYVIKPRHAGAMVYHCHVQAERHMAMGLIGMLIVEENKPNNHPQTLNVGGGKVRHPANAVKDKYQQEYDLIYAEGDKELGDTIQQANDPRIIDNLMNRKMHLGHDMEYYLLNGKSFPYTLRESLIVVEMKQKVKLHVFNAGHSALDLHPHGHKVTEIAYDGMEVPVGAQITRDILHVGPSQRVDLLLDLTNDGVHSYGEGTWLYHDHGHAITTGGMGPGGDISAIVYKSYLLEGGVPKTLEGAHIGQYFTKEFYAGKTSVWAYTGDEALNSTGIGENMRVTGMDMAAAATASAAATPPVGGPGSASAPPPGGGGFFSNLSMGGEILIAIVIGVIIIFVLERRRAS
jgi:plastocyanin